LATSVQSIVTQLAYINGKEYNQATSQVNDSGNIEVLIDVFSQNLASQNQGDENSAALAGQQDY
jgi:hypothetical protein